jgi:CubicO group peptidase (beta-lactamase class C family)
MAWDSQRLQELVDDVFPKSGVAGAGIGVLADGRISTAVAGVASDSSGAPVEPSSVFPLASLSKVWGATLAMTLVDEGVLDLDAPVVRYVPELRLRDQHTLGALNMRHLLSHTHGLDGDALFRTGDAEDALAKAIDECATLRQVLPLGATSSYGNTGVMIAARVVEKLTGTTWDAAMRRRVFAPLGLTSTATDARELRPGDLVDGHVGGPGDWQPLSPAEMPQIPRSMRAGGGLLSTPHDVLRFVQLHLSGGTGEGILSPESVRLMQEPQTALPGLPWPFVPDHWGLGWMLMNWSGGTTIGHDGGGFGGTTYLRAVPEQGVAVVLLTNSSDTRRLMLDVFGPVLEEEAGVTLPPPIRVPSPAPPFDPTPFAGRYVRGDNVVEVRAERGRLAASMTSPAFFGEGEPVTSQLDLTPHTPDQGIFVIEETAPHDASSFQFFELEDGTKAAHSGARAFVRTD